MSTTYQLDTATTFLPIEARATARFAVMVVLPTPPLPEVTVMTFPLMVSSFGLWVIGEEDGAVTNKP